MVQYPSCTAQWCFHPKRTQENNLKNIFSKGKVLFGCRAILRHKQHIVHCMVQYPCCTAREDGTIKYHSIPPRPRIPEGKRQNCHNLLGPHNNYNTIIFLNINIKVLGQDTNQIAFVVNEAPFVINLGISQYCGVTE